MPIATAHFVKSSATYTQCPKATYLPEIAFLGRSNVGKSSLINLLVQRKGLAKTSAKPGKTRLINHFLVNNKWYLVDLPGYGWAQVSKTTRAKWTKQIQAYLQYRPTLAMVLLLLDARLPLQAIDAKYINWLGQHQVPLTLVLTKADRKHRAKALAHQKQLLATLAHTWTTPPPCFITSAINRTGHMELQAHIDQQLTNIPKIQGAMLH